MYPTRTVRLDFLPVTQTILTKSSKELQSAPTNALESYQSNCQMEKRGNVRILKKLRAARLRFALPGPIPESRYEARRGTADKHKDTLLKVQWSVVFQASTHITKANRPTILPWVVFECARAGLRRVRVQRIRLKSRYFISTICGSANTTTASDPPSDEGLKCPGQGESVFFE